MDESGAAGVNSRNQQSAQPAVRTTGSDRTQGVRVVSRLGAGNSASNPQIRHTVTLPNSKSFVFETNGDVQTVYDGKGRPISRSQWTPSGAEAMPLVQPAAMTSTQALDVFQAARHLYNQLSKTVTSQDLVCLAFSAQQFKPNQYLPTLDFVGKLTRAETASACQQLDTVQTFIDEATAEARTAGPYSSAAVFGTAVHTRLRDKIVKLRNPYLKAEHSLLREMTESPMSSGIVRVDVIEDYGIGPVCVYDLKTGRQGLSSARALEFATRLWSTGRPIIVIEMMPFE